VQLYDVHILTTQRTQLRELAVGDAEFIRALLNDAAFLRFIGDRQVRTVEDAATFIESRYRQSYRDHRYGLWAVVPTATGEPVGICGFVRREGLEHPDIGFAFLQQFTGQGYASEAAAGTLAYGRDTLGLTRVLAIVQRDNERSIRLLTSLGFVFARSVTLPSAPNETLELLVARP
jgi:[ribosomal protein S5]-alanine N-acetyltransferase